MESLRAAPKAIGKFVGIAVISFAGLIVFFMLLGGAVHYYSDMKLRDQHYTQLNNHYTNNKYDEFVGEYAFFRQRDELDYKNVKLFADNVRKVLEQSLKNLPENDYLKKMQMYKQLAVLLGDSELYKEEIAFCRDAYREQQKKEQREKELARLVREKEREKERAAREREWNTPQNSPWDGSVLQVKNFLKYYLKDPDSFQAIKWGRVIKSGNNYTVRCTYRAKNSFGGYVIESKLFTMNSQGQVIDVASY